jgi:hypothetical protein
VLVMQSTIQKGSKLFYHKHTLSLDFTPIKRVQ